MRRRARQFLCRSINVAAPRPALNAARQDAGAVGAVFTETNSPTGNSVVAFSRAADGSRSGAPHSNIRPPPVGRRARGRGGGGATTGDSACVSARWQVFDVSRQLPQPAYGTLALRAEWTDPSERYTIAISGTNVTNTRYYNQASQSGSFGVSATYGPPPMIEGSLRIRL